MNCCATRPAARWLALVGLVFAYFVIFPDDALAVTAPIKNLLRITEAVSPYAYMLAAVAIIASIVRVWGPRDAPLT